jgi:hypothetical protein
MAQWIAIDRETGKLFEGKQGIYSSKSSLKRAIGYWAKHDKHKYIAVELTPAVGKNFISLYGEELFNESESFRVLQTTSKPSSHS